ARPRRAVSRPRSQPPRRIDRGWAAPAAADPDDRFRHHAGPVPLAVSGNSGGAFISAPLAIVVIGGLFTSTLLTLILVPVLYSIASRFTGPRSTRDLDEMFDAAQDRRFKPIGGRGSAPIAAATAADGASAKYSVKVTLEPEPGRMGDRTVLERMVGKGLEVAAVPNSAKVSITIPGV